MEDIKSIEDTIIDRDFGGVRNAENLEAIREMFEEFADETASGTPGDEALAYVFGLEPDYIMDGKLLQYYNGRGA